MPPSPEDIAALRSAFRAAQQAAADAHLAYMQAMAREIRARDAIEDALRDAREDETCAS
ncbi:MAG: hypothetical protein RI988_3476 [Pseudomonadota bacterium]|jgi:hypothetical protein